jgi:hypothetical protein
VPLKPLPLMQLQQQLSTQQELLPDRSAAISGHTLKPCSGA